MSRKEVIEFVGCMVVGSVVLLGLFGGWMFIFSQLFN